MDFCMSVAAQLMLDAIEKGSSSNVVLSPLSITLVLNLLASGSNGETRNQFLHFLGAKDTEELNSQSQAIMSLLHNPSTSEPEGSKKRKRGEAPIFSLVNAVWVDRRFSLKPSFKEITDSTYKARVKNVDFSRPKKVIRKVNSWTKKATKGLIEEILPLDANLSPPLILGNALYFRGTWETTFKVINTRDEQFHLLNGEVTKVPFMTMANKNHSYGSFKDFKLLKMPYKQGGNSDSNEFSMCIFLPHEKAGLKDLVNKFNDSDSAKMLSSECFNLGRQRLSKVWIPKLKFSHGFDAIKLMKGKGLRLPFVRRSADFTNMVDLGCTDDNVYVKMLLHKAYIEVDEEGTEAAAVTAAVGLIGCARRPRTPPPSFVADHPFLFMIVEDSSKVVVFTGVVLNPLGVKG